MQNEEKRGLAIMIAAKLLYRQYKWAGDDPIEGFDCSGIVIEILKSIGTLPREGDWSANDLAHAFKSEGVFEPGDLVFYDWNLDGKMDHVEMVYKKLRTGEILTIGASGGDATTKTEDIASAQNAYIKIRPMRLEYAKVRNPF